MTAFGEYADDDSASTLKQRDYKDATDLVCATGSVTHALRAEGADASEDGTGRGTPMAFDGYNQMLSTTCQTLRADKSDGDHVGMVLVPSSGQASIVPAAFNVYPGRPGVDSPAELHACPTDVANAVTVTEHARQTDRGTRIVSGGLMQVRRLTPTECERLQGFPDGWTDVPFRGKAAADGPRYKALGNSMAVPCMRWIGERIAKVAGMGS